MKKFDLIGQVFNFLITSALTFLRITSVDKKVDESTKPKEAVGESSGTTLEKDVDDILKIIKMSDYRIVDQLLQKTIKDIYSSLVDELSCP